MLVFYSFGWNNLLHIIIGSMLYNIIYFNMLGFLYSTIFSFITQLFFVWNMHRNVWNKMNNRMKSDLSNTHYYKLLQLFLFLLFWFNLVTMLSAKITRFFIH